jgi:hypothetical protein
VSLVARQYGLNVAELFQCRKSYLKGSLIEVRANVNFVPTSDLHETIIRIIRLCKNHFKPAPSADLSFSGVAKYLIHNM